MRSPCFCTNKTTTFTVQNHDCWSLCDLTWARWLSCSAPLPKSRMSLCQNTVCWTVRPARCPAASLCHSAVCWTMCPPRCPAVSLCYTYAWLPVHITLAHTLESYKFRAVLVSSFVEQYCFASFAFTQVYTGNSTGRQPCSLGCRWDVRIMRRVPCRSMRKVSCGAPLP